MSFIFFVAKENETKESLAEKNDLRRWLRRFSAVWYSLRSWLMTLRHLGSLVPGNLAPRTLLVCLLLFSGAFLRGQTGLVVDSSALNGGEGIVWPGVDSGVVQGDSGLLDFVMGEDDMAVSDSAYIAVMRHLSSFISVMAQPQWAQCGGIGWTGDTYCTSGNVCTYINDYYSQCLPGTTPPYIDPPIIDLPTTYSYGQCGGTDWAGGTMKCPPGYICSYVTDNYRQCLPTAESADPAFEYKSTLQGVVGTTPSGALTYQIPLAVPVGTAGVQPQLSVVYNSQSGASGILGAGVGLSGLSAISRVGKDFYHDITEKTGITLTGADKFALDGQRLIQIQGTSYYDTEMASFSEIQYLGANSGFTVKAKDGSTLYYGQTPDSRTVTQWLINRMQDANGNYIDYKYHTDAGYANQIKEIHYTGNSTTGQSTYNKIVFYYLSKASQRKFYVAGQSVIDSKLLSGIYCYAENIIVKDYDFVYTEDKKRLEYVREFDIDGQMIGELKFEWKENPYNFASLVRWTDWFNSTPYPTGQGWNTNSHPRMLADVTGDGKADMVGFSNQFVEVAVSSGSGISGIDSWYQGLFTASSNPGWDKDNLRWATDANGDGLADIVGCGRDQIYVSRSIGKKPFSTAQGWLWGFGQDHGWQHPIHPRHLADFNGDGLPDIIAISSAGLGVNLNNNGQNFQPLPIVPVTPIFGSGQGWNYNADISSVADINGDGRYDIVALKQYFKDYGWLEEALGKDDYYNYTLRYAFSKGNAIENATQTLTIPDSPAGSLNSFRPFFTDVNGDGNADFVYTVNTHVLVYPSTGLGFESVRQTWLSNAVSDKIDLVDVNGDGLPDVVAIASNGVWVYLNTGTGFSSEKNWSPNAFWNNLTDNNFHLFGDMNGD
ncbi:MAG: FG-GAP-like repeat-containing protein, partial [Bacteroidales bacterium]|nr:FG-GAP-like repeat-containing protein [Bacteroidales bacterium]